MVFIKNTLLSIFQIVFYILSQAYKQIKKLIDNNMTSNEEIENLKKSIETLQQTISEQTTKDDNTFRCIKYELKKLKNAQSTNDKQQEEINELILNNDAFKQKLIYDFRCIKYELRKLKNAQSTIDKQQEEINELKRNIDTLKLNKTKKDAQQFTYNNSDPFNGILMHLTKKTDGNIQLNHTIDITSSRLSCGQYEALVDYNNVNGHAHIAGSPRWLQFDLKERKIEIDSYLIKSAHTNEDSDNAYYLKNWKLEISNDGNEWSLIDERSNDSYLNGNYNIHLYKLNQISKPFRFIRIISAGENWNSGDFTIGKFELFGNIIN